MVVLQKSAIIRDVVSFGGFDLSRVLRAIGGAAFGLQHP
jgi:hypothetical protein